MIPISVNSTADAVKIGVDNYRHQEDQLANAIGGFGKALEKGIITSRLYDEDAEDLKISRHNKKIAEIQEALARGDNETASMLYNELYGVKSPSTIPQSTNANLSDYDELEELEDLEEVPQVDTTLEAFKNNLINPDNYDKSDADGQILNGVDVVVPPSKPIDLGVPNFDKLAGTPPQINPDVLDPKNLKPMQRRDSTVHRAAETAGIPTGYLPMSQQDNMGWQEHMMNAKAELANGLNSLKPQESALVRNTLMVDGELNPQQKAVAFNSLGWDKDFQTASNALQMVGVADANGQFTAGAKAAATTQLEQIFQKGAQQARAAGNNALAGRLQQAASNAASAVGTGLNSIAAAISEAFGSDKQQARIAEQAFISGVSQYGDSNAIKEYVAASYPQAAQQIAAMRQAQPQPQMNSQMVWDFLKGKNLTDEQIDMLINAGL